MVDPRPLDDDELTSGDHSWIAFCAFLVIFVSGNAIFRAAAFVLNLL